MIGQINRGNRTNRFIRVIRIGSVAAWATLLLIGLCAAAQPAAPRVRERPFPTETAFVRAGKPNVLIIHGKETDREAQALRGQLQALCGVDFPLMLDTEATGGKRWTLREEVKRQNLLVLGNINNNRAVLALYAQFLAAANGRFPGPGRYVIRHLAEPFVPERTAILVGASDGAGLQAGLARFVQILKPKTAAHAPALPLPFLEFGDGTGPSRIPRGNDKFRDVRDAAYVFYTNGSPPARFAWNATRSPDAAWAAAGELLRKIIASDRTHYPCGGHYEFQYNYQALRILIAHGLLNRSELRALEEKLINNALSPHDSYAKRFMAKAQAPGVDDNTACRGISRHSSSAIVGHWLLLDYLARFCPLAEPAAGQIAQAHRGFTRMIQSWNRNELFRPVTDPREALDCPAFMIYAYMQMELEAFVENGVLRHLALLYLGNVNNLWTDTGIGDYIGAYNGTHLDSPAGGLAVRALAFFTGDRRLEWLRTQVYDRRGTYLRGFKDRAPMCLDQPEPFSLPAGPDPGPPSHMAGFLRVPVDPYIWRTTYAEEHTANPRELTHAKAYDVLVFREGWTEDDASLALGGMQGLRDDTPAQRHSIGGYTELGARFLFGNSFTRLLWHRTGVSVDSGQPGKQADLATIEACVNGPDVFLLTSRARAHDGTVWDRTIIRRQHAYTLVLDDLAAERDGDFLCTANWRILPRGRVDDDGTYRATAPNGATFTLQPGQGYRFELDRPSLDGGSRPTFLRQYQSARLGRGQAVHFHNLIKAENAARAVPCSAMTVADGRAVRIRDASDAARDALAGTGPVPPAPGLPTGEMTSYYLAGDVWALGGATRLALAGRPLLTADRPVSVLVRFGARELRIDVPDGEPAAVKLDAAFAETADPPPRLKPGPHTFRLALPAAREIAAQIARLPHAAQPPQAARPEAAPPPIAGLALGWEVPVQQPPDRILEPVSIRSNPQPDILSDPWLHDGFFGSTSISGGPSWESDQVEFTIDAGTAGGTITGLRICGGIRDFELAESVDGRAFRPVPFEDDREHVYIGYSRMRVGSDRMSTRRLAFRSTARYLKLRCRGEPGKGLLVKELQVLGEPAPEEVWGRLMATPLRKDGPPLVLCRTGQTLDTVEKAGAITALGPDGKVLWRHEDTGPAQYREKYWVTGDVTGDGNRELLTYSDANVLTVYRHDGRVLRTVDIAGWETARKPGWTYDSHAGGKAIAVWPRAADGTSYVYLFGHVHHYRLKLFPETEVLYRKPGDNRNCAPAASVTVQDWSGPGSRNLIGLTPYEAVIVLWEDRGPDKPPHVVVTQRNLGAGKPSGNNQLPAFIDGQLTATPPGVVVATPAVVHFYEKPRLDSRWSVPHAVPVSALAVADMDGDGKEEAWVGQANGRVSVYDVASGERLHHTLLAGRVRQILPIGNGRMLVGTHDGLTLLDAALRNAGQLPCPLEDATVWRGNGAVRVFVLGRDGIVRGYAL
ncbi:MAG: hypothetical protein JXR37_09465 [Kiritimatiellae bacterium]|nr:hypothetical protein [Kiritimatiellia bacterium]